MSANQQGWGGVGWAATAPPPPRAPSLSSLLANPSMCTWTSPPPGVTPGGAQRLAGCALEAVGAQEGQTPPGASEGQQAGCPRMVRGPQDAFLMAVLKVSSWGPAPRIHRCADSGDQETTDVAQDVVKLEPSPSPVLSPPETSWLPSSLPSLAQGRCSREDAGRRGWSQGWSQEAGPPHHWQECEMGQE